jgi:thiopeptide-type bacteriocin biosynthesis protein
MLDSPIEKEVLLSAYERLQMESGIPQQIIIMDDDQKLFIDLKDETYLRLFHTHFQKNKSLRLQEFLFTRDNCFITGEGGKYANEVIIPFTKKTDSAASKVTETSTTTDYVPQSVPRDIQREFIVGSEWLYLKIYTGTVVGEQILKTRIKPLIQKLLGKGIIEKWFFIRYADPKPHLRIRFYHSSDKNFWKKVIDRINTSLTDLVQSGAIEKIQFDTYVREVARYGYDKIEFSESMFHSDSDAIIDFIDLLEGEEDETFRWLMALRNIDMLLSDFQFELENKGKLLEWLKNGYIHEFELDKEGIARLDQLYRSDRKKIGSFLDEQDDAKNETQDMVAVFRKRSERNRSIIKELTSPRDSENRIYLPDLVASHIHMSVNRMLTASQRKQELVLYYLLARHYESRLAFIKYNT